MAQFSERMDNDRAEMMKQRAEMPLERMKIQNDVKAKERDAKLAKLDLETTREGPRLNERVSARVNKEIPELKQSAFPPEEKETLYAKGYLSEQELLQARMEFESLQTQQETAELALEQQTRQYRQPEIKAAELKSKASQLEARVSKLNGQAQQGLLRTRARNQGSRVESSQRRMGRFQVRLEGSELRAPFDGVILYPLLWGSETPYVGMQVWSGLPVIQVAKTNQLKIETRINEFDIPYVKAGLPVKLSSPGFPDKLFEGKVTKVQKLAKFKDEKNPVGLKYFDVEIELTKPAPELKANMTLEVAIQARTLKQAWTIPLEALLPKDPKQTEQAQDRYLIRLENKGQIQEQEVQVLARNQDFAAIQGNFSGSERVVLAGGG
jgi:multidrug resistance efflux pump